MAAKIGSPGCQAANSRRVDCVAVAPDQKEVVLPGQWVHLVEAVLHAAVSDNTRTRQASLTAAMRFESL
jgi:hypothetical protein